jgi:DNA-binding response OmpR family regulator
MKTTREPSGLHSLRGNPTKPFNVLVVDDEKYILSFVRIKLQSSGYNVLTAENGFEALRMLKKQEIDLAIVDLIMPKMDGLELIRIMRVFTRIPIIMLTAKDYLKTQIEALTTGADEFMGKPFDPDELVARIEGIRKRRAAKASHGLS